MKRILDVRGGIFGSEKPLVIGFIVGENELGGSFAIEMINGQSPWRRADRFVTRDIWRLPFAAPRPSISKPEGGENGERRRFGPRLTAQILMQMSFGAALAYSMKCQYGLRRRSRCRRARTPAPSACGAPRSKADKETPVADTYRAPACSYAWEYYRDDKNTFRSFHDGPEDWKGRKTAP